MKPGGTILELGAGTGAYCFYYAERGCEVTATDLSPGHVARILQKLSRRGGGLSLTAAVADALDLSGYASGSYDAVLCLGPIYHLARDKDRRQCIGECLRVLKSGGLLAVSYINKHNVIHAVMANMREYFKDDFVDGILSAGAYRDNVGGCFLSVGAFSSPAEIEELISAFGVEILDHGGVDGITSLLRNQVNELDDEQYDAWVRYMLGSCRERSILGLSNHGLVVCRKNP